jgi:hypothetical protein
MVQAELQTPSITTQLAAVAHLLVFRPVGLDIAAGVTRDPHFGRHRGREQKQGNGERKTHGSQQGKSAAVMSPDIGSGGSAATVARLCWKFVKLRNRLRVGANAVEKTYGCGMHIRKRRSERATASCAPFTAGVRPASATFPALTQSKCTAVFSTNGRDRSNRRRQAAAQSE